MSDDATTANTNHNQAHPSLRSSPCVYKASQANMRYFNTTSIHHSLVPPRTKTNHGADVDPAQHHLHGDPNAVRKNKKKPNYLYHETRNMIPNQPQVDTVEPDVKHR